MVFIGAYTNLTRLQMDSCLYWINPIQLHVYRVGQKTGPFLKVYVYDE